MIKRLLVICLLIFVFVGLKAQPYGNEWLNYSQKYYKIKIAQNGVCRIDSATLSSAGIPLSSIDPRNFQLFNKGIEQYIYVQGESDGVFNTTDYIEFYAEKNDGQSDSVLYFNTVFVPNPYYSLISDTAVYFLTWNNSTNNKRMTQETDVSFSSYTPSSYFLKEEIQSFHGAYYEGETDAAGGTDCRYTKSEGWFDANVIVLGNTITHTVNTPYIYTSGPNAIITTVIVGASKDDGFINSSLPDHRLRIQYKGSSGVLPLSDVTFMGYDSKKFIYNLSPSLLGSVSTDFSYTSILDAGFLSNRTVVSYITIKYPHTYNLEGQNSFLMYVPDDASQLKSYLNINNFASSGTVRLYDLSNN